MFHINNNCMFHFQPPFNQESAHIIGNRSRLGQIADRTSKLSVMSMYNIKAKKNIYTCILFRND